VDNSTGPVLILGLGGLLLFLWLRNRSQQPVAVAREGSPGLLGYGSALVGGTVSLAGKALSGIPPAAAKASAAVNSVTNAGASVVNNMVGAALSVPNNLISQGSSLITTGGNAGASAGRSVVHALSLGTLF
jgi:hypothetical protein